MRRLFAVVVSLSISSAAFPCEAAASMVRVPEGLNGGMNVPLAPPVAVTAGAASLGAASFAPALIAPALSAAPAAAPLAAAPALAVPTAAAALPALPASSVPDSRPATTSALPAPALVSTARADTPAARGDDESGDVSRASSLFDGAAADGPEPVGRIPRRPTLSRRLLGVRPATPGLAVRTGLLLAKVTGASALWGLYRDGVLVQRYAARLSDQSQATARRTASARLLASFGRLEAVPVLGAAAANDPSSSVRRAAHAALLHLADGAAPRLRRTLKANPFPVSREAAAVSMGWLARHEDAPEAVDALSTAGLMDRSEGVRRAAITALAGARSAKAVPALRWMLEVERRPVMRAAIERALNEARARLAADGRAGFVAPPEDLPLAASPLHAAALKSSIAVGLTFAAIEFAGGLFTGTLALKADALHLAGDRMLDAAALFAMWIARRPPTSRKTYGWLKSEAVFSLVGALAIAGMGLAMVPGLIQSFLHPVAAEGWSVLGFAALSVVSNLASAAMLHRHQEGSLGIRGAFLHALTDAVGTIGVMVAAAVSLLWGWPWLLPIATAAMVVMVLRVAWELGRPAWDVLLDSVPAGVDMDRLETDLRAVPGVAGVYDLHVRSLNSRGAELAAKLYARPGADHAAILASANAFLKERYGVVHSTIQIETAPAVR